MNEGVGEGLLGAGDGMDIWGGECACLGGKTGLIVCNTGVTFGLGGFEGV